MKFKHLLSAIILFITGSIQAQFTDNMESYTVGQPIHEGHWTDWCGGTCSVISTDLYSHSTTKSGLIPNDSNTDSALDLGNKIFGIWSLSFWMYIPTNKEAFWSLIGCVPMCAEDWHQFIFFNYNLNSPGKGTVENTSLGTIPFLFPHDQWFNVSFCVDITSGIENAQWQLHIAGNNVIPEGTPYISESGEIPTSLGGINFFSISSNNEYYVDDFTYINAQEGCLLNTSQFNRSKITLSPNPSENELTLTSLTLMNGFTIYDAIGKQVMSRSISSNQFAIDISSLTNGIYFITTITENTFQTLKFIKKSAN
ncbi:MAG: T9SS type A sorting domain-containing protein [Flavobacteriaceae bacterium]|nr:T9SS type A sorting domain-containing protein [Flavobacteriaceae bacterium]